MKKWKVRRERVRRRKVNIFCLIAKIKRKMKMKEGSEDEKRKFFFSIHLKMNLLADNKKKWDIFGGKCAEW